MQVCARSRSSRAFPCSLSRAAVAATSKYVATRRSWLHALARHKLWLTRFGQARSLASEAAKQHNAAPAGRTRVLDWYAFDFQEELSGLDGEQRLVARLET